MGKVYERLARYRNQSRGLPSFLAALCRFALVLVKLLLEMSLGFFDLRQRAHGCAELLVARGADRYGRTLADMFYDPDSAFWHIRSLTHREGRT